MSSKGLSLLNAVSGAMSPAQSALDQSRGATAGLDLHKSPAEESVEEAVCPTCGQSTSSSSAAPENPEADQKKAQAEKDQAYADARQGKFFK